MPESVICMICTHSITAEKYAQCESCRRPSHYDCADLSSTEQRCLELKGKRRVKYHCDDCEKGLRVLPELLAKITALQQEIEQLRSQTEQANRGVVQSESLLLDSVLFERTLNEISDRQMRSKNIIMYKVAESLKAEAAERQKEDIAKVNEIMSTFNNSCPEIQMAIRLGKREDKNVPRPLKIVLKDSDTALNILRRNQLYKGTVQFSSDKTIQQRNHLKSLKLEVERLNAMPGAQKRIIKYRNGIPQIVTQDSNKPKNLIQQQ
ncbi:hypothetical protein R5R35_009366 [Gryllus longicercus]|uniref:PHD-type domain-containing protein n=1 Tax=Gryllus longicercus TaxID=2509291 RepID=A0AAN9V410_9ORTH